MDLEALLSEHRIPFRRHGEHHHVTRRFVGVDCPWCGEGSGTYKLGISIDGRGICSCWTCGVHRLGDALAMLADQPLPVVLRWLDEVEKAPGVHPKSDSAEGRLRMPKGVNGLLMPHLRYLKGRGFDPEELVRLWKIGGIGMAPRLSWRIFIPIHLEGQVVNWTTRTIGDDSKRYVSAGPEESRLDLNQVLYGMDHVCHAAIICEGPTDAWRIGPGAVAVMGLQVSADQVELMSKIPRRTVCFDNETEAQRRAEELAEKLSLYPGETWNAVVDSGDPGEASEEEVSELRTRFLK